MRWGLRGSSRQQPRDALHPRRDQEQQDSKGKSKAVFSSFSPLAWLSKLTARINTGAAAAKPPVPVAAKSTAQAAAFLPPNFQKPAASTSPASASLSSPSGSSSASSAAAAAAGTVPRRAAAGADAAAADIAPRRRSVGNDDTESDTAAARRHLCRRRHYSVGGDRDDLLPLGHHLISLSRSASPKPAPVRTPTPTLPPLLSESDTDADAKLPPRCRRRRARRAASGGRRSFSSHGNGKQGPPGVAVRVRSPRVSELERFAVVRRTHIEPSGRIWFERVKEQVAESVIGPHEIESDAHMPSNTHGKTSSTAT